MKRFKLLNNITGWVVGLIATVVYLMTIEPTASFWDCGEFIATAYKLEIGHPPGAPFFMLMGRLFSLFASDTTHVAMMVNAFSALCSGLCILFLFWTITHLAKNLVLDKEDLKNDNISVAQTIAILGAGAVGALAYTFTDTFWFSAVEGEVYAFSSLFTAVVFWAMLKWEDCADEPYANRWLVFIAYLMGLSVGVHLLNLLTIPVLVLVYYYRKTEKPTYKGAGIAVLISLFILAAILYGIIPGFAEVAGWFELFFVNVLGFSYNVGTIIYAIVLIGCLIWGIKETFSEDASDAKKRNKINVSFVLSMVLLGIPFFGSGRSSHIILALILIGALVFFLYKKAEKVNVKVLNTILVCCTVLLLGYSSYAALVIRSVSNPPMDENSPDDVFALKSYLNREQYGDNPLFYGYTYASEYHRVDNGNGRWSVDQEEKEPLYAKSIKDSDDEPDQYIVYDHKKEYKFCPEMNMLFPRMYSKQQNHINAYKQWGMIKGKTVKYKNMGQTNTAVCPTFGENLIFFFRYQIGFMYWRYFMWNFVGRQNDIQGHGELLHGNWISGISFIDNIALGNQDSLPSELANNKGRNTYYFLPLILGLLGILYQFNMKEKGMQSFWLTCMLFLMTGLAIVVYLNQTPYQPRERDYAYAGSFYAFCIWIGLGVLWLSEAISALIKKITKSEYARVSVSVATLLSMSVPAILAQQNWDDHDRSNRYTCRDFGANYLLSLAPNSIIFTNGDNDTFPLWYNQEVEGVGEDQRVANLSYLQMGWYVSQMTRDAYSSKAMPISLKEKDYSLGKLDVAYVVDGSATLGIPELSLDDAMKLLTDDNLQKKLRKRLGYDEDDDIQLIPTKSLYLVVDSTEAVDLGKAKPEDVHRELNMFRGTLLRALQGRSDITREQISQIENTKKYRMYIDLSKKNYLGKQEIFILNMLANNHWERPMYYAVTVGRDSYMGLDQYFQLEGMAYRIMPVHCGRSNTEIMYDNMMNKFKYGNAKGKDIYLDENNQRMCTTFRHMFARLAADLYEEGTALKDSAKLNKAVAVLDRCMEELPSYNISNDYSSLSIIDCYYKLGQDDKADKIADEMYNSCNEYLTWMRKQSVARRNGLSSDIAEQAQLLQSLGGVLMNNKKDDKAKLCSEVLMQSYSLIKDSGNFESYSDEEE